MKPIFLILGIFFSLNILSQNTLYTNSFAGTGDNQVFKSIIDSENNIYLVGYFNGAINNTKKPDNGSGYDAFVSKYDENGNLLWFKNIGSKDYHDYAVGLTFSNDEKNIFIVGYYLGSRCFFGDESLFIDNYSTGTADAFIVNLNASDGSVNKYKRLAFGNLGQVPTDIATDKNDNLIIIGYGVGNNNITYFDENTESNKFTCLGPRNPFLIQLDQNFAVNWFKSYSSSDIGNTLYSIDVDNTGYYIAGINKIVLNLDLKPLTSMVNNLGVYTQDMLLFKTDFYGNEKWIRSIKGSGNDVSVYSTCDQKGHIYISGYYTSSDLSVDSTATLKSLRTPIPNKGGNDLFFAKYKTDGTLQWFDYAGSKGDDRVTRLSTNSDYIVIAGQFGGEMTLNNKVLKPSGTLDANGVGKADALGIVHDKNDNILYAFTAGGDQEDVAQSGLIDSEGNYIFTGNFFSPTLTFDETHSLTNSTIPPTIPITRDVFIAKYKARSISLVSTPIKCSGGTANITANPKGAWAGTKKYLWSKVGNAGFSETTPIINNVSAGIYNCTITDDLLNTETASVEIKDPLPLSISIKTKTDAKCYGSANGYIEPEVTGGTGEKYYQWTGTGNGLNAKSLIQNSLTKGIYNLTVTDENGCVDSENNIEIIQPGKIIFKDTEPFPINGSNLGSVNLVVQGGISDYGYLWSGPSSYSANVGNITGLTVAGSYTVTVTDQNLCKADTTVLVVNSNSLYGSISQKKMVSCFGVSDGSITVSGHTTNPTPSFSYAWTGPGTFTANTASINNIPAGTYSVTITDTHPEPDQTYVISNIVITQPASGLTITASSTDETCFGKLNGMVDANPVGGTIPYSFKWEKDGIVIPNTTEVISSIGAGSYKVIVTDALGCTNNTTKIVTSPVSALSVNAVTNPVTCRGAKNDGTISLNVSGATGTVTYKWSNGFEGPNLISLPAGTYSCTITDNNKCSVSITQTVDQPPQLSAQFNVSNVSCNGSSNGAIDLTPIGGNVGTYSYLWSNNNSTSKDISGLSAGTYTVKITDSKKCEGTFTSTITEPADLNVSSLLIQNANCNGATNGSISLNTTGGTLPYNWVWSNNQSGPVATNLSAGNYSVTVTDANSCSETANFNITEPTAIIISEILSSHNDLICNGVNSGVLEVSASGSSGTYEYSIDGNTWQATGLFSNLSQGDYQVMARDQSVTSCNITSSTITINQPAALTLPSIISNDITCSGLNNGTINAQGIGGTGALAYSLLLNDTQTGNTTGATSGIFTGLTAGTTYKVRVTDANNCGPVESSLQTILEPQAVAITTVKSDITCFGLNNGTINVQGTGGTGALAYSLLLNDAPTGNLTGATSGVFTGLTAGTTYKVRVTDANNCGPMESSLQTILEPQAVSLSTSKTDITCYGLNNGTINAQGIGGTGALAYSLLLNDTQTGNTSGATSGIFTGLTAGTTYKVRVTDANNCGPEESSLQTISEAPEIIFSVIKSDVSCFGSNNGAILVLGNGGTGALAYSLLLNDTPTGNTTGVSSGMFTGLTAGTTYKVRVTDANNCGPVESSLQTIFEPQAVSLSASKTDITCFGLNNGTINAQGSGGTGALAYSLLLNDTQTGNTTGATSGIFTGLTAGTTYKVRVTDENYCGPVESSLQTLSEAPAILLSVIKSDVSCFGSNNGAILALGEGGTGPLTYKLLLNNTLTTNTTGASSGLFTNLSAGTSYTVQVTDANNCGPFTSSVFSINEPEAINISSALATDIHCFGLSTGTINVQASGGNGALTYNLLQNDIATGNSSGTINGIFTDLAAGSGYKVEVTDSNNCGPVVSSDITITQPAAIAINDLTVSDINCKGETSGSITVEAGGGTGALSYRLLLNDAPTSNLSGESTGIFTNVVGGTSYRVEVTDANNCGPLSSSVVILAEPSSAIEINGITSTDNTCKDLSDGSINVIATGGTGALNYRLYINSNLFGNNTSGTFTGLPASNSYSVTVTDENNCSKSSTQMIEISEPLNDIGILNVSYTDVSCAGLNNGTITVQAQGGTGLNYKLLLDDVLISNLTGTNSGNFTGLAPGNAYKVLVNDANNCGPVLSDNIRIADAQPMSLGALTVNDISCFGLHNGRVRLQATGGKKPLTYKLLLNNVPTNNVSGTFSGSFSNVASGSGYTIEVNDANNCGPLVSSAANVTEPSRILITAESVTRTTGGGQSDGSVGALATGGTGTLTYTLNTGVQQTNGIFSSLPRGTYSILVTDANNCGPVSSNFLIIDNPTSVELIKAGSVRLYPNPATEKVFIEVKNSELKDLKVELKNMTGQAAVTQKFENVTPGFIAAIDLYQLPKGIYVIVVNNQVLKEKLVIQ